jgi:hypothetical protein
VFPNLSVGDGDNEIAGYTLTTPEGYRGVPAADAIADRATDDRDAGVEIRATAVSSGMCDLLLVVEDAPAQCVSCGTAGFG